VGPHIARDEETHQRNSVCVTIEVFSLIVNRSVHSYHDRVRKCNRFGWTTIRRSALYEHLLSDMRHVTEHEAIFHSLLCVTDEAYPSGSHSRSLTTPTKRQSWCSNCITRFQNSGRRRIHRVLASNICDEQVSSFLSTAESQKVPCLTPSYCILDICP